MQHLRTLLVGYFVVFASILVFLQPVYEAPDEVAHLDYMNFLSQRGELPDQYVPEKAVPWEGHQPPLYYALGALLIHTFKDNHRLEVTLVGNRRHSAFGGRTDKVPRMNHLLGVPFPRVADRLLFYSLRLFSVFLGALALVYIGKMAALVVRSEIWSVFPVLFVATLPQFAFMSAVINNDNLANALGALAIYHLFRLVEDPAKLRDYVATGIFLGLGLLTKKTLLCLVPGATFISLYLLYRYREQRGRILAYMGLAAALVLAISGWMFARNLRLYGDLLGTRMEKATLPGMVAEKPLFTKLFFGELAADLALSVQALLGIRHVRFQPAPFLSRAAFYGLLAIGGSALLIAISSWLLKNFGRAVAIWMIAVCLGVAVFYSSWFSGYLFGIFVETLFGSFVGSFGYLIVGLRQEVYVLYAMLFMLSTFGVAWRFIRERFRDVRAVGSLVFALTFFLGIVHYNLTYTSVQGRWLFPALGPIAILVALGLQQIVVRFGRAAEIVSVAAAVLGFVVADVQTIYIIHLVYYGTPQFYL